MFLAAFRGARTWEGAVSGIRSRSTDAHTVRIAECKDDIAGSTSWKNIVPCGAFLGARKKPPPERLNRWHHIMPEEE
jgi:hypothetical protein